MVQGSIIRARALKGSAWVLGTMALLLVMPRGADAQGFTYARGQTVQPAFEGWTESDDGSYTFWFGYLNRNWEEEPDVPVGPNNFISPGPEDRGQPTHFLPRRNRLLFSVQVPADFSEEDEVVWTLKTQGATLTATGFIASDYFIDHIINMSENGSIGNGATTPAIRANEPPASELEGETERWVQVGEPLTLAVKVHDDTVLPQYIGPSGETIGVEFVRRWEPPTVEDVGAPMKPGMQVPIKVNGLSVSWFVDRGEGEVTFDPEQIKVWEDTRPYTNSPWAHGWIHPEEPADGRWVARATFHEPGTYVLKARATDGGLHVDHDVIVHVAHLVP